MEEKRIRIHGDGWKNQLCTCFTCCFIIAGVILFLIQLTVYTFKNPDPTECWYIDGVN